MGKMAIKSDQPEVLEHELNRGLFNGAFWSFYTVGSKFDSNVSQAEVIIFLKDMTTKKIFETKKLTIEQKDIKDTFKIVNPQTQPS